MRQPPFPVLLTPIVSLSLLATPPARAQAPELAPEAGTVEVLAKDESGRPTVARVALGHGLPAWLDRRMGLGGTWSYMLAELDGVVVFDVGPRYPLAWWTLPAPAVKGLARRLPGNRDILAAVERLFPGRPISQIVFSHWHPDHTEDGPGLQQEAASRFGFRPPLRMMGVERPFRWRGPMPAGAEAVFRGAGFRQGDWTWGPDLEDGALIGGTGFRVLALPGHTLGNVALLHDGERISIGPPPRVTVPKTTFWTEARDAYPATVIKFYQATYGYRHYSTHPGRERTEAWPGDPPSAPQKRQALAAVDPCEGY